MKNRSQRLFKTKIEDRKRVRIRRRKPTLIINRTESPIPHGTDAPPKAGKKNLMPKVCGFLTSLWEREVTARKVK